MLKVEIRQYQFRKTDGTPYRWNGATPSTLTKYEGDPLGLVENNVFSDITELVLNLESIDFVWKTGDNDNHLKQSITEEMEIAGSAAAFVKDWLVNRPYSVQNAVEVRFTDLICGKVIGNYLIKPQKIGFCINDECNIRVTAVQNDAFFDCIARTKISDNKNGFLTKEFRAYDYAVEKRPAVMTAVIMCLAAFVFIVTIALLPLGFLINLISRLFGGGHVFPTLSDIRTMFRDMVGLGRVHAVAGARDYINNVCEICGVTVDTPNNYLYKHMIQYDGTAIENPFYWLDIMYAETEKGRHTNDPEKFKLNDINIPIIGLDALLNDLARVFNAKWYLTSDGKLRFLLKQEFADLTPVIDFEDAATLEANYVISICQDVTDKTQPLTASYGYQKDTTDLAANDVIPRYNSSASYDADGDPNPMLKGHQDNTVPFGATSFRDDGVTKDYLDEATNNPLVFLGAVALMLIGALFITTGTGLLPSFGAINGTIIITAGTLIAIAAVGYITLSIVLDHSFTDVIVMSQDICSLPKLLINGARTDGRVDDARALDGGTGASKTPNLLFNPTAQTYDAIHTYNREQPTEHLRNYPLFYDVKFKKNIYDFAFSKTDNRINAVTQRETRAVFIACCSALDSLGVYDGTTIAIDRKFKFPQVVTGGTFVTNTARIETITANFMTRRVEIIGTNFN